MEAEEGTGFPEAGEPGSYESADSAWNQVSEEHHMLLTALWSPDYSFYEEEHFSTFSLFKAN